MLIVNKLAKSGFIVVFVFGLECCILFEKMKQFMQFILVLSIGMPSYSCSDDDDTADSPRNPIACVAPELKENIVGSWQVSFCTGSSSVVTFSSDTIFSDPNSCLISVQGVPIISRYYTVVNDTLKYCITDSTGGRFCSSYDPPIENSCNRIVFPLAPNFPNQTFERI